MHATAPSSSLEPQEGQTLGKGCVPEPGGRRAPLPLAGPPGTGAPGAGAPAGTAGLPTGAAGAGGILAAPAATGCAGAAAAGATNACLHDGQPRRLPPALSGTCIDFWQCG